MIYYNIKLNCHLIKIKFTSPELWGIVKIDEKNYSFSELKSFWIFEEPEQTLSVITKKITQSHLSIPLDDQNLKEIRKFLIKFIPEKKQEESLSDVIARKMKF